MFAARSGLFSNSSLCFLTSGSSESVGAECARMVGLAFLSPFPTTPRPSNSSSLELEDCESDLDAYDRVVARGCIDAEMERKTTAFRNRRAMAYDLGLLTLLSGWRYWT